MTDPSAQAATQLMSANPSDWPVAPSWQGTVDGFFTSATGQQLLA